MFKVVGSFHVTMPAVNCYKIYLLIMNQYMVWCSTIMPNILLVDRIKTLYQVNC